MQEKLDVTAPLQLAGLFLLLMGIRGLAARRWPLSPVNLVLLTLAVAGVTAAFEATWYALSSGIDPSRILAANLSLGNGLRPAIACLAAGLLLAAGAAIRAPSKQQASAGILA
jgi:sulfoxide reductase heme-binding subunit YedZ